MPFDGHRGGRTLVSMAAMTRFSWRKRPFILDDLGLERVAVIYPGAKRYPLGDSVEAVPLKALTTPGSLFIGDAPGS
jgi:hypothetical protein